MTIVDIRQLEQLATEKYSECPKQVTIVRHVDLEDDSEFPCRIAGSGKIRTFIVPGQEMALVEDRLYGKFSVIRVSNEKNGPEYALLTSVNSRMGFLMPPDKLPDGLLH